MTESLESILAGVGGVAGFTAILALLLKIWPGAATTLSTWLYSHVDPLKLPYGSPMNAHWAQTRELADGQREIRDQLATFDENIRAENRELRKDSIKNVLISLMADKDADHSTEIRYELEKLAALDADCWVIDAAKEYITQHLVDNQPASR